MKRILMAASALALVGGAAFAGGYTAPVTEAPVPAPVVAAPVVNANWDGAYVGAQLGYGNPNGLLGTDGAFGGLNAGYMKDYGSWVLGGEVATSAANMETGDNSKVKNFTDVKLLAGIPSGKWLTYGALGVSYMKADYNGDSISDTVPMVGIGVKYQLNDNWAVGAEADYRKGHNFDDTDDSLNLTTVGANVSYNF